MIKIAKNNIKNTKLEKYIQIENKNFLNTKLEKCIITNPPYDKRIKLDNAKEIYNKLLDTLKSISC
jgi:23S rRNA G2445 N2-methylase RlmL